jgi:hypothetical protein
LRLQLFHGRQQLMSKGRFVTEKLKARDDSTLLSEVSFAFSEDCLGSVEAQNCKIHT